jgi:hypothetical protein
MSYRNINESIRESIPAGKRHISNSLLGEIKRLLLGESSFFGSERFLLVGSELHRRVLEPYEPTDVVLTEDEETLVEGMVKALMGDSLLTHLLKTSTNELVLITPVHGIMMKVIIDIKNGTTGADLKTTSCTTENAFINSCKKYGYFRQAYIYMAAAELTGFIFIAVSKKNGKVWHLDVSDYPEEMVKAEAETKLLIDVIKQAKRFNDMRLNVRHRVEEAEYDDEGVPCSTRELPFTDIVVDVPATDDADLLYDRVSDALKDKYGCNPYSKVTDFYILYGV